jgi:hypothetical protein
MDHLAALPVADPVAEHSSRLTTWPNESSARLHKQVAAYSRGARILLRSPPLPLEYTQTNATWRSPVGLRAGCVWCSN